MDTPFSYKLEKTYTADYWRIWTVWAGVLIEETKRTGIESGSEINCLFKAAPHNVKYINPSARNSIL